MKIKDLIEKGVYVGSLNCKRLKSCDWSHYFCADTSEVCGCSWPEHRLRRKQRAVVMTLGLLLSARSFPVPQDSRQVPFERWSYRQTSPLCEHVLPLPAQMSVLTSKGFLWEVSPEKLKAVGKGKLRLGEQQAPGYSRCFLCLLSRVFIFSVVCYQDLAFPQKVDLALLARKNPTLAILGDWNLAELSGVSSDQGKGLLLSSPAPGGEPISVWMQFQENKCSWGSKAKE